MRVTRVKAHPGYELELTFADGTTGRIRVEERLFGPVFEPLHDPKLFEQVAVDEFGAVCWPGGADLAPDALYEQVNASARAA